jgi:hypothetical protein
MLFLKRLYLHAYKQLGCLFNVSILNVVSRVKFQGTVLTTIDFLFVEILMRYLERATILCKYGTCAVNVSTL